MFGVLVDVSGSMQYSLSRSHDASVERTHAILTTVVNIVKQEVGHHGRRESIFVSAFGLSRPAANTCDLISLLEYVSVPKDVSEVHGHEGLIRLAAQHGAPHAERWIREHLSVPEARLLYRALKNDLASTRDLINLIPRQGKMYVAQGVSFVSTTFGYEYYSEESMVKRSDAYQHAQQIIDNILQSIRHPKPRQVLEVSEMLDDLLEGTNSTSSNPSLHDRIAEVVEPLKPYIYGGTPMCQAMSDALSLFDRECTDNKVLFILSDGMSGDGHPGSIAKVLHERGITIVTCFVTSDPIPKCKCLFDPRHKFESGSGQDVLFSMSSVVHNTHTPVSYLVDANWDLPSSGESRLFVQANTLDVVDEFCELVVSQMTSPCDAIVHLLEKLPLATYITEKNADLKPEMQSGLTCYAHAIATVFHLAMHRIVGREGGIPHFSIIRQDIIKEFGNMSASTEEVIKKICPKYRLHYRKTKDEIRARQAINERRPVIADFWLFYKQWEQFFEFYNRSPKAILKKSDIAGTTGEKTGHAVVLTSCDSKCLTFMNSWGPGFAEGGFFRVESTAVLNNDVLYFDVYWDDADLLPSEVDAYERKCVERARKLAHTYPSIKNLIHECPKCNKCSKVDEFCGHILEAECPKCHSKFKPTNEKIIQSLYSRRFI